MTVSFFVVLLLSVIRLSTPMFIAGLGNMYCERVGILNLGAEGMMVSGAFAAVLGSYYTGNPWIGVLCGMVGGLVAGALHALICVEFGGLHAISGLGITMLFNGVTKFLCLSIFGSTFTPNVAALQTTKILQGVPVLGKYLGALSPLVYLGGLIAVISYFVIFRTPYGLRVQMVGDDPRTVETAGIDVWKMRYSGVLICGLLCGIAGAYMSLGQLDRFFEGMIAGKGMLAVIAVKMGKWEPKGILGTALLLGFFDAVQLQLQINGIIGIPPEMLQLLPYVAGIAVLSLQTGATRLAALDTQYLRNKYKF